MFTFDDIFSLFLFNITNKSELIDMLNFWLFRPMIANVHLHYDHSNFKPIGFLGLGELLQNPGHYDCFLLLLFPSQLYL